MYVALLFRVKQKLMHTYEICDLTKQTSDDMTHEITSEGVTSEWCELKFEKKDSPADCTPAPTGRGFLS
jgi:hypothetical protein